MIKFGALMRMAKDGIGPDEIGSLLESAGMNVTLSQVERKGYTEAFTAAGAAASLPGSRMGMIHGTDKEGGPILALLISAPRQA